MPSFPRFSKGMLGKGKKVAFSVLGTPSNIADKKSAAQQKLDKDLLVQATSRVR